MPRAHETRTRTNSPPAHCRDAEVHIGRVLVLLRPVKRVSRDPSLLHGTAAVERTNLRSRSGSRLCEWSRAFDVGRPRRPRP